MTELDIAEQIRDGLAQSPTMIGQMALWEIRITGTGLSYRSGHDEYVWRDPSIYLNDRFLQRCNGLPVIWEHPEATQSLNSDEFTNRVVGTVMLPFIRDDAVWAICRLYDADAIRLMGDNQLSTSPAVVFKTTDGNKTVELNGETFLIEGNPSLLDHVCICGAGVWDQGRPPDGVRTDALSKQELIGMTEDEKAVADKARKDAEAKLDAIMDSFKRMDARLDSMEADKARRDSEEKERDDRARHDAARKDRFGVRKDGETFKDWSKRHDADEMAMADALRKDGDEHAEKVARDARKDAEEAEKRADAESFERWAAKEPTPGRAPKEERMDAARHDAAAKDNADLRAQLAALQTMIKGLTQETSASERDELAAAQSRADSIAAMFGERAPTPIPGESPVDYRKRLLSKYQRHSDTFATSRFDSLDSAMLHPIEEIIYRDAAGVANAPEKARAGILIARQHRDAAGRTITTYNGDNLAWMQHFYSTGEVGRINRNPNGVR